MPDEPEQPAGPKDPLFSYVERFAAVLVAAGFPPMPARVFVTLLVTGSGRLSAAELAEVLQISPAAVSGAVRYLIQLGLVHKERVPGSRRDYYRMPGGMWDSLIRQRDQVMTRWTALVREGIDLVGPDTPAGERLAEQADFLDFTSRELSNVLERWEQHRLEQHRLEQHRLEQHDAGRGLAGADGDSLTGMRYLVRERLFSITDDFWVTDEHGNKVFLVDGKALRLRQTFELKDASGAILATIRKRFLSFTDTLDIEHDGEVVATVQKAVFSLLHHRAYVDIAGRGRLEAVGNIIDKDFEIRDGGQVIAQVSRAWFRIRDTYGVDIAPGENEALIICVAICLDRIHHDEDRRD